MTDYEKDLRKAYEKFYVDGYCMLPDPKDYDKKGNLKRKKKVKKDDSYIPANY